MGRRRRACEPVGRSWRASMHENPYASPATADSIESVKNRWTSEPPHWGRLDVIWDLCFLFGFVWVVGSSLMYVALVGLAIALGGELGRGYTPAYYDLVGYISFVSCSVIALIVGAALVVKRRETFRQGWPNWRQAGECLVVSTIIMAPAWAAYALLGSTCLWLLPVEPEWVGIAAGAFLGIVHGYVCKRGLRYRRRRLRAEARREGASNNG